MTVEQLIEMLPFMAKSITMHASAIKAPVKDFLVVLAKNDDGQVDIALFKQKKLIASATVPKNEVYRTLQAMVSTYVQTQN